MGALSKPLFALAPTAGVVLAVRVADRIGKGVRGGPRDALVANYAHQCPFPGHSSPAYALTSRADPVSRLTLSRFKTALAIR
jgi:hypothetical protein